jgi:hypothetical protein
VFPHPKPPIGDKPEEAEVAAFIRSARAQGLGADRIFRQVKERFSPRGDRWHRRTIQRVVARIDEENTVRQWLETEAGRAELSRLAHDLVCNAEHRAGLPPLAEATSRLAFVERLTRAVRGQASASDLDALAHRIATAARRRPGRPPTRNITP